MARSKLKINKKWYVEITEEEYENVDDEDEEEKQYILMDSFGDAIAYLKEVSK